jgi:hypothetical protein
MLPAVTISAATFATKTQAGHACADKRKTQIGWFAGHHCFCIA